MFSLFWRFALDQESFSLHMASYGLHVGPFDHGRNSHRCRVPMVKLDMAVSSSVEILTDLINLGFVVVVLAAVPRGTASRARDIRVSASSHGPPPLRSQKHPRSLPKMSAEGQLDLFQRSEGDQASCFQRCNSRY